ncbi:type II secretion system F family protein [Microbacterium lushaniae]|uniref:Type II secretion system F family protein n=1 Tax=Microbacterium lushaniae TaxID=2614639 RepID=A0A5J6L596_9MICO|nr:type II secretion system F family protein [Microbacterium lushaniae]QEW03512.1 type II secretion system F family protein [Microbacterium lushaniae]
MSPGLLTEPALAVILGTTLGVGVCLLVSLAPRVSAPSLVRRVAPYLRDVTDPLGLGPALSPVPTLREAVRSTFARVAGAVGGSESLDRRLSQAGWRLDAAAFRARQLAWALAGLAAGGLLIVAAALAGRFTPPAVIVAPVLAGTAVVLCDARLTWAARGRTRRIEEELPTVLDFLALCLSAGEGILDSLRRVGEIGSGELTGEIRRALLAVGTGEPLPDALTALGRRLEVPALSRALDQVVAALERGAPLAHVLQAQATDAREGAKRALIEQAGRKEILMLIPLVFLILPLSVLYAVFPGIFLLRLGIG